MHLYIESLGCARNQVDSENMAGQLRQAGWSLTREPAEATVIVVNTCSFVESAINESIDTILELARFKKEGRCRRLVVAGCLPERFREAIVDALPEVDQFLGTGAFHKHCRCRDRRTGRRRLSAAGSGSHPIDPNDGPGEGQSHTAYLKIAEGCSRHCTIASSPGCGVARKAGPSTGSWLKPGNC
jgi:ribosomal protein S12 methylthiotransferase